MKQVKINSKQKMAPEGDSTYWYFSGQHTEGMYPRELAVVSVNNFNLYMLMQYMLVQILYFFYCMYFILFYVMIP